jgi:hypothetical protein
MDHREKLEESSKIVDKESLKQLKELAKKETQGRPTSQFLELQHTVLRGFDYKDYWKCIERSVAARAEWELIKLVEKEIDIIQEYNIEPGLQNGMTLNWTKMQEHFWIPSYLIDYADAMQALPFRKPYIFSDDEKNSFQAESLNKTRKYTNLINKVLIYSNTSKPTTYDKRVEMLTTTQEQGTIWKTNAKEYAKTLLNRQSEIYSKIGRGDKNIVIGLVKEYQKEMM